MNISVAITFAAEQLFRDGKAVEPYRTWGIFSEVGRVTSFLEHLSSIHVQRVQLGITTPSRLQISMPMVLCRDIVSFPSHHNTEDRKLETES